MNDSQDVSFSQTTKGMQPLKDSVSELEMMARAGKPSSSSSSSSSISLLLFLLLLLQLLPLLSSRTDTPGCVAVSLISLYLNSLMKISLHLLINYSRYFE